VVQVRGDLGVESRAIGICGHRNRWSVAVELGEVQGNPTHLGQRQPALGDRLVEHPFARQSMHLDQPVDRLPEPAQAQLAVRTQRQRHDAQIDVRRQPPIEPHFLLTASLPGLEGSEVEELIAHRLLQLVGEALGQEHPGHVGFDGLDALAALQIGRGPPEEGDLGGDAGVAAPWSCRPAQVELAINHRFPRPVLARFRRQAYASKPLIH
jgi:hypothetical protein